MSGWRGILDFWRRMTPRLQDFKKTKLAAATREVRQQRTLHDTKYLYFVVKFVDLADITINNKQYLLTVGIM